MNTFFRSSIFRGILILLLLPLLTVSCWKANTQNTPPELKSEEPGFYIKDIDYPAPLADRQEQLLFRKAYLVSYNSDTRQPNWVAWHLTADHVNGNIKRPDNAWHDDKEVPEPRAYYYDYKGTEWDRGHMCPAGDNKWDSAAMYESFLMTNCCPQNFTLNSGQWNQIELSCRQWAKKYGDIYIVCGPLFLNQEHDSIGTHCIPVPEAFFKVVVCLNPDNPRGIGFICRNTDGNRKKDYDTISISEVERKTNITFFPNLPADLNKEIKNSSDITLW